MDRTTAVSAAGVMSCEIYSITVAVACFRPDSRDPADNSEQWLIKYHVT